jgi:hypothetical protein
VIDRASGVAIWVKEHFDEIPALGLLGDDFALRGVFVQRSGSGGGVWD